MNTLVAFITSVVNGVISLFTGSLTGSFGLPPPRQTHRKEFSVDVVRPDDLLVLTLDFYNIRLDTTGPGSPQLERIGPRDGFIVAHFQPQSFGEQAFFELESGASPPSDPLLPPPVASRIAGPSKLVFRIAPALLPRAFSLEEILAALNQSGQVVQGEIQFPTSNPPVGRMANFGGNTRSQFSAIEAPYRLILSPNLESRWQHALAPAQDASGKRAELWHTRLSPNATASAVWSPDYDPSNASPANNDLPIRMSLKRKNRHEIVRSTADPNLDGVTPVDVGQMMLSSQGAWLKVHGQWNPDLTALDLVEWRHIMTTGRDQYARIVEAGYMFCTGHRAVIVTITERKIQMGLAGQTEGKPVAYLRQRKKIFIRQPTKTYQHRDCQFRTITIKTAETPNLDLPTDSQILSFGEDAFWPRVDGKEILFHLVATDWEGREIEFHIPLAFVIKSLADNPVHTKINQVITHFNGLAETDERRGRSMGGQKIAYAPSVVSGDTTFETAKIIFGATGATASPFFLPASAKASVDIPAVRQISGSTAPSTIQFRKDYLETPGNTVIGNMGEVFAELVGSQTPVKFSSDQTGGMVAPNFGICGLSRPAGPVGGTAGEFAQGKFDPTKIFPGVKLFGGIDLAGIIMDLINLVPGAPAIPKLKTIRTTATIDGITKDVIQTSYDWDVGESGLIDQSTLPTKGMFGTNPGAQFSIKSVINNPLDNSKPSSSVEGSIKNFRVTLMPAAPLVALHFTEAVFTARQNAKVDFAIIFNKFEFLGILTFVNKIMDVIPMDGFDDPPFLDLVASPPGVRVGFTLGIPSIGVGIFTLQNISFGASFYLGFLGDPANLRLAFCERHQPFTLTVSLFGGGGFFAIDIGLNGVKSIEAALEFGAAIALNLGVASGQASIMGGVYYQSGETGFAISAYFRAAGSLSVLGIITVSVELYIALSYESDKNKTHGGKLWGQASITVKIKIVFFSIKVSVGIEREFAGSDPKFIETVSPSDWSEYCTAFADCPA